MKLCDWDAIVLDVWQSGILVLGKQLQVFIWGKKKKNLSLTPFTHMVLSGWLKFTASHHLVGGQASRCLNAHFLEHAGILKNDPRTTMPDHCCECQSKPRFHDLYSRTFHPHRYYHMGNCKSLPHTPRWRKMSWLDKLWAISSFPTWAALLRPWLIALW